MKKFCTKTNLFIVIMLCLAVLCAGILVWLFFFQPQPQHVLYYMDGNAPVEQGTMTTTLSWRSWLPPVIGIVACLGAAVVCLVKKRKKQP